MYINILRNSVESETCYEKYHTKKIFCKNKILNFTGKYLIPSTSYCDVTLLSTPSPLLSHFVTKSMTPSPPPPSERDVIYEWSLSSDTVCINYP